MKDQKYTLSEMKQNLEVLMRKIQNFDELDNFENLISYCDLAIPLADKLEDYYSLIVSYRLKGFALFYLNRIDLALSNYEISLSLLKQNAVVQKTIPLSHLYVALGHLHKIKSEFSTSLFCFVKALENDFKDGLKQSTAYNNLALLFRDVKDLDRAQNYIMHAIAIESQSESTNWTQWIRYQINLAGILELKGEIDLALSLLKSVEEKCLDSKDYQFIVTFLRSLGSIYIKINEFSKAESVILKALDIAENKGVRVELVRLHLLFSDILKYKGFQLDSYENLSIALSIAEKSNKEDIDKVLLGFQIYYSDIKDFENLFLTMKRRFLLSKDRFEKEKADDFWKMKASFQLEETERQLIVNRNRNVKLEKKNADLIEALRSQRYLQLRLLTLQHHLCPKFIISKLQAIQELILANKSIYASDRLVDFASLMRAILKSSRADKISLKEEVEVLNNLVSLEQLNPKNSFDFTIEIDPDLNLDTIFPPSLVFLSILEQAIKEVTRSKTKSKIIFLVRKFRKDVFFHFFLRNLEADSWNLEENSEDFETKNQFIQRSRAVLSKSMDKSRYSYRMSKSPNKAHRVYSILLLDCVD